SIDGFARGNGLRERPGMSRRSRRSRRPGQRPQFDQRAPGPPRGPAPSRMPAPSPSPSGFESLTAIQPFERLRLETVPSELSMRAMDLHTPIRKGLCRLLVAPPRTGKTGLLQQLANALLPHHPDLAVSLLLVD